MEKLVQARLWDIVPSDTPKRKNWQNVCDYWPNKPSITIPLDLDSCAIKITSGNKYKYVPIDGNHRLGRLTELFGITTSVSFTLFLSHSQEDADELADGLKEATGISTFLNFVESCSAGKFYRWHEEDHLIIPDF